MSQTRRRQFLIATGALLAAPRAFAQATKSGLMRKIGFLTINADPDPKLPGPRRQGPVAMSKLGWTEGENVVWERAYADLQVERLAGLAEGLVHKGVDVLLTDGPEATLAAARATKAIPIVFVNVIWPIEQGLIDSFARPGRNVTGVAFYTGVEVTNKRNEFLREAAPAARRLSWLWSEGYAETLTGGRVDIQAQMDAAAKALGYESQFHDIGKLADVEKALAAATTWGAQAIAASGVHVGAASKRIADFCLRNRLPSTSPSFRLTESGGLLSYGPAPSEYPRTFARWIDKADRILRGANPAELPVERPSKYDLVINMKTANALGLKIPQSLLVRAERVIE